MSVFTDILGAAATVITGGVGGGVLRLIPEVIKLFAAKGDRDHEYRMRELDWKIAQQQGDQQIRAIDAAGAVAVDARTADAWVEAIKAQGQKTGIWIADLLNALVRPVTTYYFLFLFGAHKTALLYLMITSGQGVAQAIISSWTAEDAAMLAGLLNFWFVGRVFEKQRSTR